MDEISVNSEYLSGLREQFQRWADFLNTAFGLLSFTLALACLGTKAPALNAWLSLVVVSFVRYKGRSLFPAEILRLRQLAKSDAAARVVLTGLSKEFLSVKALIISYPVFLIGYVLLTLVAFSPALKVAAPWLAVYVGA
jgi:hypothetical protein